MAGRQKVSREQVLAVLGATKGNVAAAARALGMHRNNLYKRLITMGLSPDAIRAGVQSTAGATPVATRALAAADAITAHQRQSPADRNPPEPSVPTSARDSSVAIFPAVRRPRSFPAVVNAALEEEQAGGPKQLRATKSLFLRPEQIKALENATYDLSFRFRERFSPSRVLERFMDECFAGWLKNVMAGAAEPPPARKIDKPSRRRPK